MAVITMVCGACPVIRTTAAAVVLAATLTSSGQARAADSAVVMMYHRFGESAYPSTNITIPQFKAHLAEIRDGKYVVRPLPEIAATLRAGRALPDKTIGLSIDDAFLSVYQVAWPLLREAKLPFTLFVATDPVDHHIAGYMSWDQIRQMAKAGVTIGNHSVTHPHMPLLTPEQNAAELEKSNERFRAELGIVPTIMAYPYGEYSLAVGKVVKRAGFIAAFGQHSGVIHTGSDFYFLPRFAFSESFGDVARFRLAARALPIHARDITPADPMLGPGNNPPLFGFTVEGIEPRRLSRLACYVSGQGRAHIERLGERRIEVRMARAFSPGRTRINCTLPEAGNRWRWFGRQFYLPPRR